MHLLLDLLANLIILKYFQNSRCLLIFTDQGNSFEYSGNIPVINIEIENNTVHSEIIFNYFGCQGIIMKTNSPVSMFKSFELEIRLGIERFNRRKFLVLPGVNMYENFTDILSTDEIMYVADLDVVEESNNAIDTFYTIWTHSYVGTDSKTRVTLDYWFLKNETFLFNINLYPDKLRNQMGRTLKIGTFHYEPYAVLGK